MNKKNISCCSLFVLATICCNDIYIADGLVSGFSGPSRITRSLRTNGSLRNKNYKSTWRSQSKTTLLQAQSNDEGSSSPRVKFTATDDSSSSLTNPLDRFLSLIASDAFSIAAGMIGLLAAVIHRWSLVLAMDGDPSAAEALTYQTRTDLLAVFASGSVLLNGVTKLDVTTALAESVVLEGTTLSEAEKLSVNVDLNDTSVSWALNSLLTATPAKTAVLIDKDETNGWTIGYRAGVVPSTSSVPEKSPILDRVGSTGNTKETYLPTLQALPGRTELTYLPSNTQMAVLIPIQSSSNNKVLVVGGNTAKSFTPRDIAWSRIVAERIGEQS